MPTWSRKMVQEVIRSILEAYYEPQFSDTVPRIQTEKGMPDGPNRNTQYLVRDQMVHRRRHQRLLR